MSCDSPDKFTSHSMAMLLQTGNVAQNNMVTMQKAMDFDYLENKRVVNLDESLGAREVQRDPNKSV